DIEDLQFRARCRTRHRQPKRAAEKTVQRSPSHTRTLRRRDPALLATGRRLAEFRAHRTSAPPRLANGRPGYGNGWSRVKEFDRLDDPDAATWTIPASRSKNGRSHVVPLSKLALEIVADLIRRAGQLPDVKTTRRYLLVSPVDSAKPILITRLRQLPAPSRTKHEHAVFAGVVRWRAIRSSSRKASVRSVSPSFTEPKGNVMRRSSNGAGRTGSNVLGAMALITASSPAARGVYSSATRVASRLLSKRERSSLQASCRCASGSRRSTWSRNQRRAFPVSNSVDALASPRRLLG